MIQTLKPQIGLTYILNFKDLDRRVRLNQALAEDAFGDLTNSQSQQTNLPDDFDPTQSRIVFSSEKKSIAISQVACQFLMNFSNSGIAYSDIIDIGRKNINTFTQKALQFKPEYAAHAFGLDLRYPSLNENDELAAFLNRHFIKTKQFGTPASTMLQLGYSYEELYLNIGINPYESRQMPENPLSLGTTYVRADSLPVIEKGIQVRIDVNNLPNFRISGNKGAPDQLMITADKFMKEQFETVCGLSLP